MIKRYNGKVPACGCFCGGCPTYVRDKKPCPGAQFTNRCEGCKTFHLCCKERNITHCYECNEFPCKKFKGFRNRWLKYGQDFLDNQFILKKKGEEGFLNYWNRKAKW